MTDGRQSITPVWWRTLGWEPWSIRLEPVTRADSARVSRALSSDIANRLGIADLAEMRAGTPVWANESGDLARSGDGYRYVVCKNDKLAGVIEVRPDAVNGHIGFWLRRSARGHGTITQANALVLLIAYEGIGLKAVDWTAAECNDKSIAVMERLGARYLDRYPTPDKLHRDAEVRYRLERRRFRKTADGPQSLRQLLARVR